MRLIHLNDFAPEMEDDLPSYTCYYSEVPAQFRIAAALEELLSGRGREPDLPQIKAHSDRLITAFEGHFHSDEINAPTYGAFYDLMLDALAANADEFERYAEAYASEMGRPETGRKEVRTGENVDGFKVESSSDYIDVAQDAPADDVPTNRTKSLSEDERRGERTETLIVTGGGQFEGFQALQAWKSGFTSLENAFYEIFPNCFIKADHWEVRGWH